MKKILFLLSFLCVSTILAENTEQPPLETKDNATTENFRQIFYAADKLSLLTSLFTYTFDSSNNLLCIDSVTFCVDALNHRVGIGTASPSLTSIATVSAADDSRISVIDTGDSSTVLIRSDGANSQIGTSSSHPFAITTNGIGAINITTAQEVTQPLQPSFLVSTINVVNVTGDGGPFTVTWGSEIYDQGSDMGTTTFTAPVTGRYHLSFVVRLAQIASAHSIRLAQITTSNRTYAFYHNRTLTEGTSSFTVDIIADMDANDTATTQVRADSSTKVVDVEEAWFSGSLTN